MRLLRHDVFGGCGRQSGAFRLGVFSGFEMVNGGLPRSLLGGSGEYIGVRRRWLH